jgi:hypothetical protein
MAYFRDIKAS